MLDSLKWQCWHCGACCKYVSKYGLKEKPNGYCIHYNEAASRCNIYEHRPKVCRSKSWHPDILKIAACTYLDHKINTKKARGKK